MENNQQLSEIVVNEKNQLAFSFEPNDPIIGVNPFDFVTQLDVEYAKVLGGKEGTHWQLLQFKK